MAATLPYTYTYIQCPCTSENRHDRDLRQADEASVDSSEEIVEEDEDFDPRSLRAKYSLYPPDHLYYCEICAQIRCQRCMADEIVTWFCPNCLFEVPSSTVKSEGNRCTRSCFQCPICISPLNVTTTEAPPANSLLGAESTTYYVLTCPCCSWCSTEIGIKFDKSNGIYNQLSRIRNGGQIVVPAKERALGRDVDRRHGERRSTLSKVSEDTDEAKDAGDKGAQNPNPDPETRFANLRTFYQGQMSSQGSNDKMPFTNDYTYASPNALSRIMNLYTTFSSPSTSKKSVSLMREALLPSEGLILPPSTADEVSTIKKIQKEGWAGTCSTAQREQQIQSAYGPHFTDELRPVPYLLRTKRTKRCKTCKHIVVRPEAKVQTARFRMKMVAASYIPTLSIKPFPTSSSSSQIAATTGSAATGLLQPHRTAQFILTVKNPLYERIRVTLATKAQTPGRFKHKVTILCPQFEVGASREAYADVWDDALADPKNRGSGGNGSGEGAAEAGKVFERGRNSVGVVVEVVPASLSVDMFKDAKSERGYGEGEDEEDEDDELREDEDVLEIPVRMRVEWEAEAGEGEKGEEKAGEKVKRELGYWVVLGMGRIARE